jgi:hypothetical protein
MDRNRLGDLHPYVVLGTLLAQEMDSPPPRNSSKRKRLRAAMRLRLAHLADRPEPATAGRPSRRTQPE